MALIERLMQLDSVPDDRHIAVHEFFAVLHELGQGNLTNSQIKAHYAMTAADEADYNVITDDPPGVHATFILAEAEFPGYDTPSAVRSKLGI